MVGMASYFPEPKWLSSGNLPLDTINAIDQLVLDEPMQSTSTTVAKSTVQQTEGELGDEKL